MQSSFTTAAALDWAAGLLLALLWLGGELSTLPAHAPRPVPLPPAGAAASTASIAAALALPRRATCGQDAVAGPAPIRHLLRAARGPTGRCAGRSLPTLSMLCHLTPLPLCRPTPLPAPPPATSSSPSPRCPPSSSCLPWRPSPPAPTPIEITLAAPEEVLPDYAAEEEEVGRCRC